MVSCETSTTRKSTVVFELSAGIIRVVENVVPGRTNERLVRECWKLETTVDPEVFLQTVSNFSLRRILISSDGPSWSLLAVTVQNHNPSIVTSFTRSEETPAGIVKFTVSSLILKAMGIMANGISKLKRDATRKDMKRHLRQVCSFRKAQKNAQKPMLLEVTGGG